MHPASFSVKSISVLLYFHSDSDSLSGNVVRESGQHFVPRPAKFESEPVEAALFPAS